MSAFKLALSQKNEEHFHEIRIPIISSPGSGKAEVRNTIFFDLNKLYSEVEQLAEFPNGVKIFRKRVMDAIDQTGILEEGILKSEVSFVVERSGKNN